MHTVISSLKHLLVSLDCARLLSVDCLIEINSKALVISSESGDYNYKAFIPVSNAKDQTVKKSAIFNAHALSRALRLAKQASRINVELSGEKLNCLAYDTNLDHVSSSTFNTIEPSLSVCATSRSDFKHVACLSAIDVPTKDFVRGIRSLLSIGGSLIIHSYPAGIKFEVTNGYATQVRYFGACQQEESDFTSITETKYMAAFSRPAISQISGRCTLRTYADGAISIHVIEDEGASMLIRISASEQAESE